MIGRFIMSIPERIKKLFGKKKLAEVAQNFEKVIKDNPDLDIEIEVPDKPMPEMNEVKETSLVVQKDIKDASDHFEDFEKGVFQVFQKAAKSNDPKAWDDFNGSYNAVAKDSYWEGLVTIDDTPEPSKASTSNTVPSIPKINNTRTQKGSEYSSEYDKKYGHMTRDEIINAPRFERLSTLYGSGDTEHKAHFNKGVSQKILKHIKSDDMKNLINWMHLIQANTALLSKSENELKKIWRPLNSVEESLQKMSDEEVQRIPKEARKAILNMIGVLRHKLVTVASRQKETTEWQDNILYWTKLVDIQLSRSQDFKYESVSLL
jgi:hypothetical protein